MKEALIIEIEQGMTAALDNAQMEHLHKVLAHCLYNVTVTENIDNPIQEDQPNEECLFRLI